MSTKVMTLIWDTETFSGNQLNVLVKMADFGDDDGASIFPRLATLARKCQVSERTVQRIQEDLEARGVLILERDGRGRGRAKHYRINVERLRGLREQAEQRAAAAEENTTDCRLLDPENTTPPAENTTNRALKDDTAMSSITLREPLIEPSPPLSFGEHPPRGVPPARGSRLPADWTLPPAWREWAITEGFGMKLDIDNEAAIFRDHWLGKSGQAGTKVDWFATWRNWMRRAVEYGNRNRQAQRPDPYAGTQGFVDAAARYIARQADRPDDGG